MKPFCIIYLTCLQTVLQNLYLKKVLRQNELKIRFSLVMGQSLISEVSPENARIWTTLLLSTLNPKWLVTFFIGNFRFLPEGEVSCVKFLSKSKILMWNLTLSIFWGVQSDPSWSSDILNKLAQNWRRCFIWLIAIGCLFFFFFFQRSCCKWEGTTFGLVKKRVVTIRMLLEF